MRILVAAVLAGCAGSAGRDHADRPAAPDRFHDLVVHRDACHEWPRQTVSRTAAFADLAIVETVIRRGYARFDANPAWDRTYWDGRFAQLHQSVAALGESIALAELRRVIAETLGLLGDGALALGAVGSEGALELVPLTVHQDAYAADVVLSRAGTVIAGPKGVIGTQSGTCPPMATVTDALIVSMSLEKPPPFACRFDAAEVQLPAHRLRHAPDLEHATFERTDRPVPTLRLRDLDEANLEALEVFVEAAEVVRRAPVAVLDLRGAHGDHARTAIDFFSALVGPAFKPPTADELHSEVTLQGQVNAVTCTLARSDVDRDARLALENRRRELSQALDDAAYKPPVSTHTTPPIVVAPSPLPPYDGTLVVVVDAACSGACELMVAFARQLPHAVIAGENTAGTAAGELLPYRLPGSGLWLQVPASTLVPADGPVKANQGYLPDLWLDTDRLDLAALARCAADAACRSLSR